MMNAELFQFNQVSLFVFLVALVGIIRERTILPYLLVVIGAFLHGTIAAALVASLVVWVRFDAGAPGWLRFKDAMALFFILAASALPDTYREFMICFGVFALAIHFAFGKLGIVPALLLVHLYLGEAIPLEFVLGASGAYIVISEILRLAKSPHEKRVRQWIELPAILGVLYPLNEQVLKWFEDDALLGVAIGIATFVIGLLIWIQIKKPDFSELYQSLNQKSALAFESLGKVVSNRQGWLKVSLPAESMKLDLYFDRLFWGLVTVIGVWLILVLIYGGGLV